MMDSPDHIHRHEQHMRTGVTRQQDVLGFVGRGTRVLLYSQSPILSAVTEPELIWLSPRPGTVGIGPSDERMYVVDPRDDKAPYRYPLLPPFRGAVFAPVSPASDGHLDGFPVHSREFRCAHIYGCLRRVLDIWQRYFHAEIPWHFDDHFTRLEIVSWMNWDNAHSGYGFLEAGVGESDGGLKHPYALNFDVLAHELGHSILYSRLGVPAPGQATQEYLALHEAFSDLIALISVLHFDDLDDRLLAATGGNLYQLNELNRIAEMSDSDQIRVASNSLTMADVEASFGSSMVACDEHRFGQPVTGAIFDIFVDIYLDELKLNEIIAPDLAHAATNTQANWQDIASIHNQFLQAERSAARGFRAALAYARDYVGFALAHVCSSLDPNVTSFSQIHRAMLDADRLLTDGRFAISIAECFDWRGIGYHETHPSTATTLSGSALKSQTGRSRRRLPYIARARAFGLRL